MNLHGRYGDHSSVSKFVNSNAFDAHAKLLATKRPYI